MKKIILLLLFPFASFAQVQYGGLQDLYLVGASGLTATVNNILANGATSTDGTDMTGYASALVQVVSTGTGGTFIFEGSNFLNTNYQSIAVFNQQTATGIPITAAITATASQIGYWIPKKFRYIRLRIASTITGGTIQAVTTLTRTDTDPSYFQVSNGTAANLQTTATQSGTWAMNITQSVGTGLARGTSVGGGANATIGVSLGNVTNNTDQSATSVTATGNGTATTDDTGGSMGYVVNLTALTGGTSPSIDFVLQESYDNGTTFVPIWHVQRLTATGAVTVPPIPVGGRRRWNWVTTGAPTTATVTITAAKANISFPARRQFFDRTANALNGTINATTSSYSITGCIVINARINIGAATTPGTYQIQVSDDNLNWSSVGTATAAVANSVITISVTDTVAQFARVICTSAGTGQTGNYIAIAGSD